MWSPLATIATILATLLGAFIGYRVGSLYVRRENASLKNHVQSLEAFATYWAGAAASKNTLWQSVADRNTSNLSTTMATVISLMQSIQHQENKTLSNTDQDRIKSIISQAQRAIGSGSEVDEEQAF